jgi:alpha-glucoside transport system permease protein
MTGKPWERSGTKMATTVAQPATPPAGEVTPRRLSEWAPWIWVAPAIIVVSVFLFYPVLNTLWLSFLNADSSRFVGLSNYGHLFNGDLLLAVRNNLIWLVLATAFTVALGLIIAVLVDRVRIEAAAKAAVFIPMAISFVGAGVIWKFIYQFAPKGETQIGLLNAVLTRFGFAPQAWLINQGVNNLALIAVYVWMWTGFCMVILSAALKGVPAEVLEAARVDGANELQIFYRVIAPMIAPTIAVVTTVMIVNVLKIFDIVYVMTGGNFNTSVVAMAFYQQEFTFNNFGNARALAVLLLLAIIPVMVYNVRRFRAQEAQR